ncbi:MAG: NAD-dependent malic enzyme [Lactobacillaceae bacterium]|jgi:malate dehydrogenase (oxaloacetate-decarboxylating)|nr:NAD-dependent malic enzyme [Lactobacillaceae bacterium]
MDYNQRALEVHKAYPGKIAMVSTVQCVNADDLATVYSPGVAQPCREIAADESQVYTYTSKSHTVAVVSDGSAVLGLGNIGAQASLPVMEGKAILFKEFGGIDAVPLALATQDLAELEQTILNLAPAFGGINLEDIGSPKCFELEARLDAKLDIPVFHDDQHGTAIVVAAGLTNALKVVGKQFKQIKVVLNGPGAAGTAIIKMLQALGVKDIIAVDEFGILYPGRDNLADQKIMLAETTNAQRLQGDLALALDAADVFIGVSVKNVVTPAMIASMATEPIVFAMANPDPEIAYEIAMASGVAVMATGRSDYPNQINNVVAFPGIFKGALAVQAKSITTEMKLAAVQAIAETIPAEQISATNIIPSAFDPNVATNVAQAVGAAWRKGGH